MDPTTLQARITATNAAIVAYEAAILALGIGGAQYYTLDNGQTRQLVTKLDLADLQKVLDSLYNTCATLSARLNGAVTIRRPAW